MAQQMLARSRASKAWRARSEAAGGKTLTFDPAIASRLIDRQMAHHRLTLAGLETASGVSWANLSKIRTGKVAYVRRSTLVALRDLPNLTQPKTVPAGGTWARLWMLAALGWSVTDLTAHCGRQVSPRHPDVTFETATLVIAALFELGRNAGPHPRAAKCAATRGHLPPSAFDRDLLADPLWDGTGGRLEQEDPRHIAAEIRFLAEQGVDRGEIAFRLDVEPERVRDTLRRAIVARRS